MYQTHNKASRAKEFKLEEKPRPIDEQMELGPNANSNMVSLKN